MDECIGNDYRSKTSEGPYGQDRRTRQATFSETDRAMDEWIGNDYCSKIEEGQYGQDRMTRQATCSETDRVIAECTGNDYSSIHANLAVPFFIYGAGGWFVLFLIFEITFVSVKQTVQTLIRHNRKLMLFWGN